MKSCPFCNNGLAATSTQCDACNRPLPSGEMWYYSTWAVVLAVLGAGPLALPLIWCHPRYSVVMKFLLTIGIVILTLALTWILILLIMHVWGQLKQLGVV